jgi:MFS family permease
MRLVLTRYRDFRWLFAGNSVSLLGSSVTTVALPLTAVVYLHASPAQMGVLGAVALLPHLILGLPAGVWVDRVPYRRVLVTADLARVLVLGLVPLLAACGALRIWQLYIVLALAGTCGLFETVAAQSFTPRLVPRQQLLPANSALMLSSATVGTTGAALGGVLVAPLTAPIATTADAASFLLAGLCKTRIRTPGLAVVRAEAASRVRLRTGILEGLRAVFGHEIIRVVTLAATIGALAGQMQAVVLVLYLVRDHGLSPSLVGAVVAAGGAAAILGALQAARITQRIGQGPAFITGMFLAGSGGLVLAAAAGPRALTLAILVMAQVLRGAGPSLYGVNQQTFRQALIPAASALPGQRHLAIPCLRSAASRRASRRGYRVSRQPEGHADHQQRRHARRHRDRVCLPLRRLRGLPRSRKATATARPPDPGRPGDGFARLVMPAASLRRTPARRTIA